MQMIDWQIVLNANTNDASLKSVQLSVLRVGFKQGICGKYIKHAILGMRTGILLFRINLDLLIRNPLSEMM